MNPETILVISHHGNDNVQQERVACTTHCTTRGSKVVCASHRDVDEQVKKFSMRFTTTFDAETFVNALKESLKLLIETEIPIANRAFEDVIMEGEEEHCIVAESQSFFVKTLRGMSIALKFSPGFDTIASLKTKIMEKECLPYDLQCLLVNGKLVVDSCIVQEHSDVHLVFPLLGGALDEDEGDNGRKKQKNWASLSKYGKKMVKTEKNGVIGCSACETRTKEFDNVIGFLLHVSILHNKEGETRICSSPKCWFVCQTKVRLDTRGPRA